MLKYLMGITVGLIVVILCLAMARRIHGWATSGEEKKEKKVRKEKEKEKEKEWKQEFWGARFVVIVIVMSTITIGAFVAAVKAYQLTGQPFVLGVGLFFWALPTFLFFRNALVPIPAQPPHVVVLTFLKERKKRVIKEGLRLFPFHPYLFGGVRINVTAINTDFPDLSAPTPDLANVKVKASVTCTPDKDDPGALIEFLNKGGHEQVINILHDICRERIRIWLTSHEEGPSTWIEARGAAEEALEILVKAILGEALERVSDRWPTTSLFKYFSTPRQVPSAYEAKKYGPNWETLEEELKELEGQSPEDYAALQERLEGRRKAIQAVRQGNGTFKIPSLGIIINRFTVPEIGAEGKVVDEDTDKAAETIEMKHVQERVAELMETVGASVAQATEVVQTERGKVGKTIEEKKWDIGPALGQFLKEFLQGRGSKKE